MFCCGSEDLNREHIFGRALAKRFPLAPIRAPRTADALFLGIPRSDKTHYRGGGENALDLTSYSMCASCNSQFGLNNSAITDTLEKLFNAEQLAFPFPEKLELLRYFQRIGALVDLEQAEFDPEIMEEAPADIEFTKHARVFPPILTQQQRRDFLNGGRLINVRVLVGRFENREEHGWMHVSLAKARDRQGQWVRCHIPEGNMAVC